jgi:hypothetical protein
MQWQALGEWHDPVYIFKLHLLLIYRIDFEAEGKHENSGIN